MDDIFGLTIPAPRDAVEESVVPDWLVPAMINGVNARRNQSEATLAPDGLNLRSPWGQRFRNAILFTGTKDLAGNGVPQTAQHDRAGRDGAGRVIREMAPLYSPPSGGPSTPGFRDLLGAFTQRAAYIMTVVRAIRYQGQIPTSQQPTIKKPFPWLDPTRGLP